MKCFKKVGILVVAIFLLFPFGVFAKSIDEVKSSKEISIKSVPPTQITDAYLISEIVSEMYTNYYIDVSSCSADYKTCSLTNIQDGTSFEVNITYEYDEDIKKVVDTIMAKLPEEGKEFTLTDIEFINYLLNTTDSEEEVNISTYSSELKKYIDYKNFTIEPRMGDDGMFFTYKAGTAEFEYDGTIYAFVDKIGVTANYVVYIDDNEDDISNAIKERLSNFFDILDVTKIEYTVTEYLNDERISYGDWYDQYGDYFASQGITKEDYIDQMMDEYYYNDDAHMHFLLSAEEDLYGVEFKNGLMFQIAVVKDSSKVVNDLSLITNDVSSDVTISTTSKSIPLDTLIQVAKLTSGEEYEKIVKILNVTNSEVFDLKLFSKSTGDYINKLDDGTFEVKLPIKDELKDKELVVYYIDENDNITSLPVTISEDYATFTTDHFSVYTLTEAKTETIENEDEVTNEDEKETISDETKTINNPQTGDNIIFYIITLLICLIGFISGTIYLKKN